MIAPSSDVAFTPAVKAVQERRGSRRTFERVEAYGGWPSTITPELAAFIAKVRSFYFATASKDGQPYVQHRGGPPGFLRVLDEKRLAFADYTGNRQYITTGNLAENPRAFIFLMDYTRRRRIKLWGTAEVIENDPELIRTLFPAGYRAEALQAIVFTLTAFDRNCSQHIPQLLPAEDVAAAIEALNSRIETLEAELNKSRS
jgi:predicted pyridoxine 5'-phosphate oxidase superfamily flavin-nucleotide-binding protein